MGAYAATKFAQVGLAECLRAELAGSRIHLSVVFPVSTDTEFHVVMKETCGAASRARGPRQSAEQVADAIAQAGFSTLPRKSTSIERLEGWCC